MTDPAQRAAEIAVRKLCRTGRRQCLWPDCFGDDHCDIAVGTTEDRNPEMREMIRRMTLEGQARLGMGAVADDEEDARERAAEARAEMRREA